MTDTEREAFLDSQHLGVLGTVGPAGLPHMVTVGYLWTPDRLLMTGYATSQKVRNLERCSRGSFLVEVPEPYAAIRGVLACGNFEIVDDPDRVIAVADLIFAKAAQQGETQNIPQGRIAPKRRLLAMTVDRWISWDHSKLGGLY